MAVFSFLTGLLNLLKISNLTHLSSCNRSFQRQAVIHVQILHRRSRI